MLLTGSSLHLRDRSFAIGHKSKHICEYISKCKHLRNDIRTITKVYIWPAKLAMAIYILCDYDRMRDAIITCTQKAQNQCLSIL